MTAIDRFWVKVDRSGGCWEWRGSRQRNGYGQFHPTRHTKALAHRFAWELVRGAIPAELQVDHLCRNRGCVNPDHMELVTSAENTRRSPIAQATLNALKSHCPSGHEYTEANTKLRADGRRLCRECDRIRHRRAA